MRNLAPIHLVLIVGCGGSDTSPAADAALPDAILPDAAAPDAVTTSAALNECDPAYLPMNRAVPLSCCQKDGEAWFLSGNQSSLGLLVHRKHGKACSLDGVTNSTCNGMDCAYGPCGANNAEMFAAPAYVFHPISDPTVCGRQGTGLDGSKYREW